MRARINGRAGRWTLGLAALLAVTFGGALATGAIPADDGEITGCYANKTGVVRIVDSASECTALETAISWNREGPQGEAGPQGAPGMSGFERVTGASVTANGQGKATATAACPTGKKAIGGAYSLGGSGASHATVTDNGLGSGETWQVKAAWVPGGTLSYTLTATVTCANVAS